MWVVIEFAFKSSISQFENNTMVAENGKNASFNNLCKAHNVLNSIMAVSQNAIGQFKIS